MLWMQSLYNYYLFCATIASHFKQLEPQRTGEAKGNAEMTISFGKPSEKRLAVSTFEIQSHHQQQMKGDSKRMLTNSRSPPLMKNSFSKSTDRNSSHTPSQNK